MELAVRRSLLPAVRFDERFGLGTRFPSGEEAIFVNDALRAGARARYVPLVLCSHSGLSSGHRLWDENMVRTKGAVIRRLFPRAWPVILPVFAASKHGMAERRLNSRAWITNFFAGARALAP